MACQRATVEYAIDRWCHSLCAGVTIDIGTVGWGGDWEISIIAVDDRDLLTAVSG